MLAGTAKAHAPWLFAKLAVTVILLAWLLERLDWTSLGDHLHELRVGVVALAFVSFLLIGGGEVARMRAALSAFGLRWRQLLRLYLISTFVAAFLPGQLGSDLYQVHFLARIDRSPDRPLALIVLMRTIGLAVLGAAALLALALPGRDAWPRWRPALPGLLLVIVGVLLVATAASAVLLHPRSRARLGTLLRRSRQALAALTPAELTALLLLSLVVLATRVLTLDLLLTAVGFPLRWRDATVVITLATLVTFIPISFAGLGLREGAVTALLVFFRVPFDEAALVAVLGRVFMVALALAGGACLLARPALDRPP